MLFDVVSEFVVMDESIFIMRGARRVVYESVSDMCAAIRELPFEAHRFQDSLAAIIGSACGGDGEKGLL